MFYLKLVLLSYLGLAAFELNNKPTNAGGLITKLCLAGFNAEINQSRLIAPNGMGKYVCHCMIKEFNEGASIESAKITCKNKAIKEFKL